MTASFFTLRNTPDGEWIEPTELCRGPWDEHACHAGPPTGMIARASESLLPDQRLVRLTVDLTRPIPHAGFRIVGDVVRQGRTVSTTSLTIVDADGREAVSARGLHMASQPETAMPTAPFDAPRFADATPGEFAISNRAHDKVMFRDAVEVRYPPGEDRQPGPTTMWMRTVPLLPTEDLADEALSGFSRISPLSDCGNAVSRNAETDRFAFVNTDLTVTIHREPLGEWFAMQAVSRWEPDGIGMSDAVLYDDDGPVGRATQTLLIRPHLP